MPGEGAGTSPQAVEPSGSGGVQEGGAAEKKAPEPKGVSRGSIRKSKRSPKSLATSPALRFIVRKDLYSFLSGAGVSVWEGGRGGASRFR